MHILINKWRNKTQICATEPANSREVYFLLVSPLNDFLRKKKSQIPANFMVANFMFFSEIKLLQMKAIFVLIHWDRGAQCA